MIYPSFQKDSSVTLGIPVKAGFVLSLNIMILNNYKILSVTLLLICRIQKKN